MSQDEAISSEQISMPSSSSPDLRLRKKLDDSEELLITSTPVDERVRPREHIPLQVIDPVSIEHLPEGTEILRRQSEQLNEVKDNGRRIKTIILWTFHKTITTETVTSYEVILPRKTEQLVGTTVEEHITDMAPGVDETMTYGVKKTHTRQDFDKETLPNGTWLKRSVSLTVIDPIEATDDSISPHEDRELPIGSVSALVAETKKHVDETEMKPNGTKARVIRTVVSRIEKTTEIEETSVVKNNGQEKPTVLSDEALIQPAPAGSESGLTTSTTSTDSGFEMVNDDVQTSLAVEKDIAIELAEVKSATADAEPLPVDAVMITSKPDEELAGLVHDSFKDAELKAPDEEKAPRAADTVAMSSFTDEEQSFVFVSREVDSSPLLTEEALMEERPTDAVWDEQVSAGTKDFPKNVVLLPDMPKTEDLLAPVEQSIADDVANVDQPLHPDEMPEPEILTPAAVDYRDVTVVIPEPSQPVEELKTPTEPQPATAAEITAATDLDKDQVTENVMAFEQLVIPDEQPVEFSYEQVPVTIDCGVQKPVIDVKIDHKGAVVELFDQPQVVAPIETSVSVQYDDETCSLEDGLLQQERKTTVPETAEDTVSQLDEVIFNAVVIKPEDEAVDHISEDIVKPVSNDVQHAEEPDHTAAKVAVSTEVSKDEDITRKIMTLDEMVGPVTEDIFQPVSGDEFVPDRPLVDDLDVVHKDEFDEVYVKSSAETPGGTCMPEDVIGVVQKQQKILPTTDGEVFAAPHFEQVVPDEAAFDEGQLRVHHVPTGVEKLDTVEQERAEAEDETVDSELMIASAMAFDQFVVSDAQITVDGLQAYEKPEQMPADQTLEEDKAEDIHDEPKMEKLVTQVSFDYHDGTRKLVDVISVPQELGLERDYVPEIDVLPAQQEIEHIGMDKDAEIVKPPRTDEATREEVIKGAAVFDEQLGLSGEQPIEDSVQLTPVEIQDRHHIPQQSESPVFVETAPATEEVIGAVQQEQATVSQPADQAYKVCAPGEKEIVQSIADIDQIYSADQLATTEVDQVQVGESDKAEKAEVPAIQDVVEQHDTLKFDDVPTEVEQFTADTTEPVLVTTTVEIFLPRPVILPLAKQPETMKSVVQFDDVEPSRHTTSLTVQSIDLTLVADEDQLSTNIISAMVGTPEVTEQQTATMTSDIGAESIEMPLSDAERPVHVAPALPQVDVLLPEQTDEIGAALTDAIFSDLQKPVDGEVALSEMVFPLTEKTINDGVADTAPAFDLKKKAEVEATLTEGDVSALELTSKDSAPTDVATLESERFSAVDLADVSEKVVAVNGEISQPFVGVTEQFTESVVSSSAKAEIDLKSKKQEAPSEESVGFGDLPSVVDIEITLPVKRQINVTPPMAVTPVESPQEDFSSEEIFATGPLVKEPVSVELDVQTDVITELFDVVSDMGPDVIAFKESPLTGGEITAIEQLTEEVHVAEDVLDDKMEKELLTLAEKVCEDAMTETMENLTKQFTHETQLAHEQLYEATEQYMLPHDGVLNKTDMTVADVEAPAAKLDHEEMLRLQSTYPNSIIEVTKEGEILVEQIIDESEKLIESDPAKELSLPFEKLTVEETAHVVPVFAEEKPAIETADISKCEMHTLLQTPENEDIELIETTSRNIAGKFKAEMGAEKPVQDNKITLAFEQREGTLETETTTGPVAMLDHASKQTEEIRAFAPEEEKMLAEDEIKVKMMLLEKTEEQQYEPESMFAKEKPVLEEEILVELKIAEEISTQSEQLVNDTKPVEAGHFQVAKATIPSGVTETLMEPAVLVDDVAIDVDEAQQLKFTDETSELMHKITAELQSSHEKTAEVEQNAENKRQPLRKEVITESFEAEIPNKTSKIAISKAPQFPAITTAGTIAETEFAEARVKIVPDIAEKEHIGDRTAIATAVVEAQLPTTESEDMQLIESSSADIPREEEVAEVEETTSTSATSSSRCLLYTSDAADE